jgi:hypothetical protein
MLVDRRRPSRIAKEPRMDLPVDDVWPVPARPPGGPGAGWRLAALALIAPLGLLVTFHHVVQRAVEQGVLRRQAAAVHADAAWRCRDLRPTDARAQCLVRLGPAP